MKNLVSAILLTFVIAAFTLPANAQINVGVRAGYLWANARSSESGRNFTNTF